jgi:hypothetical protein
VGPNGKVSSVKDGRRFYLFINYVLLSQKSHVELFLAHMLSLGVTLHLSSLEMAKS